MKKVALVVDDDTTVRRLLSELLEIEGYRVETAEHGGPALDVMRSSPDRLIVLLGLAMPYVNGQQALEAVAADQALAARHAIIMVTGSTYAAKTGPVAALRAELDVPLIPKPFTPHDILEAVEQAAARLDRYSVDAR